jgi:copper transport outer membrane protein MctB
MINFRYHVVSLVGVFLALGVGIIMGSTVVDQGIVTQLRKDSKDFAKRNAQLRAQTDDLNKQLQLWDTFGAALVPELVRGKLKDHSVTMVLQEGIDGRAVNLLADTLVQAGATKPARLTLTKKWMLVNDADRSQLSAATGASATDKNALLQEAATDLGARLGTGGDPRADTDLIRRLDEAGFVKLDNLPRGTFPASGSLVVALVLGDPNQSPSSERFAFPLVQAISANRPTVVGEPFGAKDSLSDRVRGERDLADRVPTVDHANTAPGRLSLVWALEALLDGRKAPHYGVHRGTDGIAPAVA